MASVIPCTIIHWNCFYRGQSWPSSIVVACFCLCMSLYIRPCESWACLYDNLWPIQARIAKCGWQVQTCFRERLNLTLKFKFDSRVQMYPLWAYLHNNSSSVESTITKFAPKLQNTLVKINEVLGIDWCWSFCQFWNLFSNKSYSRCFSSFQWVRSLVNIDKIIAGDPSNRIRLSTER